MGASASCPACGLELRTSARFCDGCGTAVHPLQAEYKQVTVLFADVAGSMQIAGAVGPERLREIMSDVLRRSAAVMQRNGGTIDKFTGDGVMAIFGAPAALEDHAIRACRAALDLQEAMSQLAVEVECRDGIALRLRVGLNSGQVITGEIGSGPSGYTAVGEQVGMAQRMESTAPPGGVMLSDSTARLVEHLAVLGEPEQVHIKGEAATVPARRLLAVGVDRRPIGRREPTLVGRGRETDALTNLLERSLTGAGSVVTLVGPPGIGKSRLVGETVHRAGARGIQVHGAFCESHARDIPFRVATRLLRNVFGIEDAVHDVARIRVRSQVPDADAQDLLLLDDLLAIGEAGVDMPTVTPDARRRRFTALLTSAANARDAPAVYVLEDVHWIDEASEAILVDFLAAVPRMRSLALISYRPEYRGALARIPGTTAITLAPLGSSQTAALIAELLGVHPSVAHLADQIADRAAGNPFFAGEIVRDLAEREVLQGDQGNYTCHARDTVVSVPATLQATIAARIDRLSGPAKQVLYAGSVIGTRFRSELVDIALAGDNRFVSEETELLDAELIDRVSAGPQPEYSFQHPLIRTVAYESQLKAGRSDLHRRLATWIAKSSPASTEQNAAQIAEHFDAAGDLRAAYDWHMRAGIWSLGRDHVATRTSWQRARRAADRLPREDPDRTAMQIRVRTLLCASMFRSGADIADKDFGELRELCTAAGDNVSLATGMAGMIMTLATHGHLDEASELASEALDFIEPLTNPAQTVAVLLAAAHAKYEVGKLTEALGLTQRVIDLPGRDPTLKSFVFGSTLATAMMMRGLVRLCLGIPGWRSDGEAAIALASHDPINCIMATLFKYCLAIPSGARAADTTAQRETADALGLAERFGDDYMLGMAQLGHGLVLVHADGGNLRDGVELLARARDTARDRGFRSNVMAVVDPEIALAVARQGDLDGAIALAGQAVEHMLDSGDVLSLGIGVTALVEPLIARGSAGDLQRAQDAIDRLAAMPREPGFVLHTLPLQRLSALMARAHGDDAAYQTLVAEYQASAAAAEFDPLLTAR